LRIGRWSAVVGAALLMGIPAAAEASTGTTSTQTTTPTAQTPTAPNTSTAQPTTTKTSSTQTSTTRTASSTSTQATPAPGGTAEAYALNLANILAISHTKASASGSGTSSTADPLELGGSVPSTQFGGTQNGNGNSKGALLDTGPSSQFRLALTPWSATNSQSSSGSTASAVSDIVLLDLGDPSTSQSASLRVLQSKSDASWTPAASSGSSSADGAILNAGGPSGLTIDLLHSESSSSGAGSSYLVSINGTPIGSSSQVNGQCALTIPSLLSLSCVTSSGGVAGTVTSSAGEVLSATVLPNTPATQQLDVVKSTTVTNSAPTVSSGSGNGALTSPTTAPPAGNTGQAAPASSGALAFTGLDIGGLVALALALGLGGVGLVWWSRRKTSIV